MLLTLLKSVSLTYLIGAVALTLAAGVWRLIRQRLSPAVRSATGFWLMLLTAVLALGCAVYIFWGVVSGVILMTTPRFHVLMSGGWAAVITASGFVIFIVSMLLALVAYLRGRTPRAAALKSERVDGLLVRHVERVSTASVVGALRPEIWVNPEYWAELSGEQKRLALEHERTHIRRRDNLNKLIAGFIGKLYAALPWIGNWARDYELDSELAVDAHCRKSCDAHQYTGLVSGAVAFALNCQLKEAVSSLNQSDLKLRLEMLGSAPMPGMLPVALAYAAAVTGSMLSVAPVALLLFHPDFRCMLACYLGY